MSVPIGAPVPAPPMFALVIAGRPLDTNFQLIDSAKMMIVVPRPTLVAEFTIALLQPNIPPDQSVAVYWSLSAATEWNYIGPVNVQHPTAAFRAPWHGRIRHDEPVVRLGLAIESTAFLATLPTNDGKEAELALDSAKGIATDLYQYMTSFAQSARMNGLNGDVLVIPTDCIDQWYKKFVAKHNREPFFWMRKDITRKDNM